MTTRPEQLIICENISPMLVQSNFCWLFNDCAQEPPVAVPVPVHFNSVSSVPVLSLPEHRRRLRREWRDGPALCLSRWDWRPGGHSPGRHRPAQLLQRRQPPNITVGSQPGLAGHLPIRPRPVPLSIYYCTGTRFGTGPVPEYSILNRSVSVQKSTGTQKLPVPVVLA